MRANSMTKETTATGQIEALERLRHESGYAVAQRAYHEALVRYAEIGSASAEGDEEIACRAAIVALQEHYQLLAAPWIERLTRIAARKPPQPIIVLGAFT
jgi:hypothetical protein